VPLRRPPLRRPHRCRQGHVSGARCTLRRQNEAGARPVWFPAPLCVRSSLVPRRFPLSRRSHQAAASPQRPTTAVRPCCQIHVAMVPTPPSSSAHASEPSRLARLGPITQRPRCRRAPPPVIGIARALAIDVDPSEALPRDRLPSVDLIFHPHQDGPLPSLPLRESSVFRPCLRFVSPGAVYARFPLSVGVAGIRQRRGKSRPFSILVSGELSFGVGTLASTCFSFHPQKRFLLGRDFDPQVKSTGGHPFSSSRRRRRGSFLKARVLWLCGT